MRGGLSPPAKPQWPHVHGVPAQKKLRRRYAAHVEGGGLSLKFGLIHVNYRTATAQRGTRPRLKSQVRRGKNTGDFLPADFKEDEEAGFMGLPFIQPEGNDEWVDNVPWEEVPEEAAL